MYQAEGRRTRHPRGSDSSCPPLSPNAIPRSSQMKRNLLSNLLLRRSGRRFPRNPCRTFYRQLRYARSKYSELLTFLHHEHGIPCTGPAVPLSVSTAGSLAPRDHPRRYRIHRCRGCGIPSQQRRQRRWSCWRQQLQELSWKPTDSAWGMGFPFHLDQSSTRCCRGCGSPYK